MPVEHGDEIPEGKLVLHSCDNRDCVNPGHLRVGTHKDNTADMIDHGRMGSWLHPETIRRGEAQACAKLTDALAVEIWRLRRQHGQRTLAKMFGVHRSTIRRIIKGTHWTHVTQQGNS